jgi:hypothetical protein
VLVIRGQGRPKGAWPAEPLKPRRDLGVIQVRMIAATGADQLEHAGVAAVEAAVHDAGRLAPHQCRPAVTGLAAKRRCQDAVRLYAQPRVTATGRAQCGDGARTGSLPGTGHDVRDLGTAHLAHRPGG